MGKTPKKGGKTIEGGSHPLVQTNRDRPGSLEKLGDEMEDERSERGETAPKQQGLSVREKKMRTTEGTIKGECRPKEFLLKNGAPGQRPRTRTSTLTERTAQPKTRYLIGRRLHGPQGELYRDRGKSPSTLVKTFV